MLLERLTWLTKIDDEGAPRSVHDRLLQWSVMRSGTTKLIIGIVVVAVAAALVWNFALRSRPARTLDFTTYETTWQHRVDQLLKGRQSAPSSCWTLGGTGQYLPGFGSVESYCWTSRSGHQLNFRFIKITTSGQKELLYMPESSDWKLQYGFCVVQLSGPWWQLVSGVQHCPAGFTPVPPKAN